MKALWRVLALVVVVAGCGDASVEPAATGPTTTDAPDPCTPAAAASFTARFLERAATDPAAADEMISTSDFLFYSVVDPEAERIGEAIAGDRSTVLTYLEGRAAAGERFEISSLVVVGVPADRGLLVNMNLDRFVGEAEPVRISGSADFDVIRRGCAGCRWLTTAQPPTWS